MRPQDIAILIKIIALDDQPWQLSTLSHSLLISFSEISESLNRSRQAALIDFKKKKINRNNLIEFIEHGVKYVFPQQPGAMVVGMPTAHSHPFVKKHFVSDTNFVWPDSTGKILGLTIEPFYKLQPEAATHDDKFYLLMALIDVIRVGKLREASFALKELKKLILNE